MLLRAPPSACKRMVENKMKNIYIDCCLRFFNKTTLSKRGSSAAVAQRLLFNMGDSMASTVNSPSNIELVMFCGCFIAMMPRFLVA